MDVTYLDLAVVMATISGCGAMQCYICTFQFPGAERDKACIDKPWNSTQGIKTMDCPYDYCVIYRQYMHATKQIYSFHRGCEMKSRGNKCIVDTHYSTCSHTCTADLCNGGDGIPEPDEVGRDYIGAPPPGHLPGTSRRHKHRGRKKGAGSGVHGTKRNRKKTHKKTTKTKTKTITKTTTKATTKLKKKQKRKDKITCLNPYSCDQSAFWPRPTRPGSGARSMHTGLHPGSLVVTTLLVVVGLSYVL